MISAHCLYFGETSFARQSRFFLNALLRVQDIALFPRDYPEGTEITSAKALQMLSNRRYACDSFASLGIGGILSMKGLQGKRKIAFTVWETTRLPKNANRILNQMDEIWTTSAWGKTIFVRNGIVESKIKIVPLGVDQNAFRPISKRDCKGKSRRFRFLCVGKWESRKGTIDLLNAFCDEFQLNENVELVLHCHNRYIPGFDLRSQIQALNLPDHPPITISAPVPESELITLYNDCDAFVLPTRAEGWGLPIMEAMACGLPVIVTEYSAITEFANAENAYLIRVTGMVKAFDKFVYNGQDYGCWAQPDIVHLRFLMRHIFEHADEARDKGKRARQDMVNKWTWENAAQKANQHLSLLQYQPIKEDIVS